MKGRTSRMIFGELPPRTRRILRLRFLQGRTQGTTSACAENTSVNVIRLHMEGNYLRVRGEYGGFTKVQPGQMELPPRARRIRVVDAKNHDAMGTTSACAENTFLWVM